MFILRFLELALGLVVVLLAFFEVVIPLYRGVSLFPDFRKKNRELNGTQTDLYNQLDQAAAEAQIQELRREVKRSRTINSTRNK